MPLLPVNLGKKNQAHNKVLMIERFLQGTGKDFRGGSAILSERQKNTCKYYIYSDGNILETSDNNFYSQIQFLL